LTNWTGSVCVCETAPEARCSEVAKAYLGSVGRGERALVVAQTWADVNNLNDAIRAEMATKGILGRSVPIKTYQAVDLGQAQKRDARYFEKGRFAYVLQRYGRFVRGDLCAIGRDEWSRGRPYEGRAALDHELPPLPPFGHRGREGNRHRSRRPVAAKIQWQIR